MKPKKNHPLYDVEENYKRNYYYESDRRDVYYSVLVKDIIKNNRTGQILKCIFFGVVCLIFALVCIIGVWIIFNISQKENITYADIGVAITGFGSVLSSIIALPKIIAKHLFPENSEKVRFDFINANMKIDQAYVDDDIIDFEQETISNVSEESDNSFSSTDQ